MAKVLKFYGYRTICIHGDSMTVICPCGLRRRAEVRLVSKGEFDSNMVVVAEVADGQSAYSTASTIVQQAAGEQISFSLTTSLRLANHML